MAARYFLTVAVCLFFALDVRGLETVNGRIKITVQTTAGCGDTVRFIGDQLAPVYDLYKDYLDVEFVPWGRAQVLDNGTVRCQFGVNDCWANRLHRCALNLLEGNQDAQVHYMTCEYTSPYPSFLQGSYLCAQAVGLSLVDADYCVSHPGDELDTIAQIQGDALTAAINFIPSIVFNDGPDRTLHDQARVNLKSMICLALADDPTTTVTNCGF